MARRSPSTVEMPWHVPVRLEDVPETGLRMAIEADEPTRATVAKLAGLRALPRLAAEFEITRHGRASLAATGEVTATVGQVCIVTLEPIESEVREAVNVIFGPAQSVAAAPGGQRRSRPPPPDTDQEDIEPLIDGVADLGVVATEFLVLGIDPYPRKPGVVFEPPALGEKPPRPFAALEALKRRQPGES